MNILFIDNYDSFTYNVVEILRSFKDVHFSIIKNDELEGVRIQDFDKIIISPGPDLPAAANQLNWFIEQFLEKKPTLGICLGHQAIAEYYGAQLRQYANPLHGEKTKINLQRPSVLFRDLETCFEVGLYHSWYVDAKSLPMDLRITALSEEGVIMALEHRHLPIYSVQFHPESYMSAHGREILQNFICS